MHVHVKLLSQDPTFDLFKFFPNFFSKIWVAKLGVRLICECGLYAGVYCRLFIGDDKKICFLEVTFSFKNSLVLNICFESWENCWVNEQNFVMFLRGICNKTVFYEFLSAENRHCPHVVMSSYLQIALNIQFPLFTVLLTRRQQDLW